MNRVIALDLLRFFAALSVVLYHYTFTSYTAQYVTAINFQEISFLFKYGNLGVELFFMISGFVILLSAENKTIFSFVVSRITRLYPAYWTGVSLTALICIIYGGDMFNVDIIQYLYNLTMIQELFQVRNIDGVYWTLFVEIKFYFLIFLLMLFRQMRFLKVYLLVWAFVSIAYHFVMLPGLVNFFLIPNVAPFFIAGSIFYIAYKNEKFTLIDHLILLLSFVSGLMYLEQHILHLEKTFSHNFNMSIIIAIVFFFYLIFFSISQHKLNIKNDKKVYILMGAVTYPLYLIHTYIGYIMFNHLHTFVNKYILLLSIILCMLFLSYLIHSLVEKNFSKYMKTSILLFVDQVGLKARK